MPGRPPIAVVGAGIAGLATALAAAPRRVLVFCRDAEGDGSASALAQGGIAAAVGPSDSPAVHARDTRRAGAGRCRSDRVRWLCGQAPGAIAWLQGHGVEFDHAPDGELQLGREGGHSGARIVHAGGDATGAVMLGALLRSARNASHIEWRGGFEVEALLGTGARIHGLRARDGTGRTHEVASGAVVLATGGIGSLFARTSNPLGADGSGLALAMAAGARVQDLEFVQFHPTALDVGGHRLPLLTEALRGAGATLRGGEGRRFMAGLHPLADLAPRDVVAREVWRQRAAGGAWLDARQLGDALASRFPTVLAACLAHGIDPRREPIPVTPAAHYLMGGIAVDAEGQSSLAGLHAVGEVASTGVHGANRLASNSLLEAVAFGRRLGEKLAGLSSEPAASTETPHWFERGPSLPDEALTRVRELLWAEAGPLRNGGGLARAHAAIAPMGECGWQARVAAALLASAARRHRSLGAHHRTASERAMDNG